MARRTKEEAEQTKQAVIRSALDLFYEKGFVRSTFDDIAKRINLTKGAVYWHFRNKADLLTEIIRQEFQKKEETLPCKGVEFKNISDLREYFIAVSKAIETDADFCKFLRFLIFQMEWSERVRDHILKQLTDLIDTPWIELKERLTFMQKSGEIPSDVNIEDLTILLSCLWRGTVDSYITKRYPMSLSVTFIQGFDMLFAGLKVEKK